MAPVIAAVPSFDAERGIYTLSSLYTDMLLRLGAIPVIIPYGTDISAIGRIADGILLTGGGDPDPLIWGEDPIHKLGDITPVRDSFETDLVRFSYERDIPVLGICRGAQIMAVALGGTLYQDISDITDIKHSQSAPGSYPTHKILLNSSSFLYSIIKKHYNKVNSFHHQAIRTLPDALAVSACSADGITEAIECSGKSFFLGVQWHPEAMTNDETQKKIFSAFIESAERYKGVKKWQA